MEAYFSVLAETDPGSEVRVVGAAEVLGFWHPEAGIALCTDADSYPRWSAHVWLPKEAAKSEFKFVIAQAGGGAVWEPGPNRRLPQDPVELCLATFGEPLKLPTYPAAAALSPVRPFADDRKTMGETVVWEVFFPDAAPGDRLFVTGDIATLGGWDPASGLRLDTEPSIFPVWHGVARLGPDELSTAWKLVCIRSDGRVEWEPGQNRCSPLLLGRKSADAWFIGVTFGGPVEAPTRRGDPPSGLCPEGRRPPQPTAAATAAPLSATTSSRGLLAHHAGGAKALGCSIESIASTASTCASDSGSDCGDGFELAASTSALEGAHPGLMPSVRPAPWLWSGARRLPKPGGRCEDAYFRCTRSLGVADGVGGMVEFAQYGADAAAYAAELMELASAALKASGVAPAGCMAGPAERAVAALAAAEGGARTYGASTATLLALEGRELGVANLGDSGFMLLRRQEGPSNGMTIVERSREQQHKWNCPYQLTQLPPALAHMVQKGIRPDSAADCQRYQLTVQPYDLLLLYTDGLSDNLHDHEILKIVDLMAAPATCPLATPTPPGDIARALARAAQQHSLDVRAQVPFNEASRKHGHEHIGGKPDDITVVAAWVVAGGHPPPGPRAARA